MTVADTVLNCLKAMDNTLSYCLHARESEGGCACCYCQLRHNSKDCTTVTDVGARKQILRSSGRCYNCLRKGHIGRHCRSLSKCQQYKGRHHISICEHHFQSAVPSLVRAADSTKRQTWPSRTLVLTKYHYQHTLPWSNQDRSATNSPECCPESQPTQEACWTLPFIGQWESEVIPYRASQETSKAGTSQIPVAVNIHYWAYLCLSQARKLLKLEPVKYQWLLIFTTEHTFVYSTFERVDKGMLSSECANVTEELCIHVIVALPFVSLLRANPDLSVYNKEKHSRG